MTNPPTHPPSETARDEVVAKIKALPFGSCADGSRHLDRDDALEILKEWGER